MLRPPASVSGAVGVPRALASERDVRQRGSSTGRIVVEVIASGLSLLVGVPTSLPFLAPFILRFDGPPVTLGEAVLASSLFTGIVAGTASLSVLLVGNVFFGQRGSFWKSWLIGWGLGFGASLFSMSIAMGLDDELLGAALLGGIVAAPIGAVVGYEVSLDQGTDAAPSPGRVVGRTSRGGPRIGLAPWVRPERVAGSPGRGGLSAGLSLRASY